MYLSLKKIMAGTFVCQYVKEFLNKPGQADKIQQVDRMKLSGIWVYLNLPGFHCVSSGPHFRSNNSCNTQLQKCSLAIIFRR